MAGNESEKWRGGVLEYYRSLTGNKDLKSSACCTAEAAPAFLKPLLSALSTEVTERFYGCGSPIPVGLKGCAALDLACGCGHDVFLLAALVGPEGRVVGVDLLDEHLAIASRNIEFHAKAFDIPAKNIEFVKGMLEDLSMFEDGSFDVVTSNCAINLSPEKERVFKEIFRVLKPGGQLFFSDVFADRRLPESIQQHQVLRGECLGGAMYWEDFRRMMNQLGVPDFRTMTAPRMITLSPELKNLTGEASFCSHTVTVHKIATLEDRCEEYGQAVRYKGTLPECPSAFRLDDHHLFARGKWYEVCGNTAAMIQETRFGAHFEVIGDRSRHFGLFDCTGTQPQDTSAEGQCC